MISLIYLAIQVRQNTAQVRENSQISRLLLQENFVSGQEALIRSFLESKEMYRIWRLGSTTTNELPTEDRERFGLLLYGQMYQASVIEPLEHERCLIQIDRFAAMYAFRSWWSRQRSGFGFDPEFVALVDDRISRAQSSEDS